LKKKKKGILRKENKSKMRRRRRKKAYLSHSTRVCAESLTFCESSLFPTYFFEGGFSAQEIISSSSKMSLS